MKKLLLAMAALLAGCHSVEEMRQRPAQWTARYSVPFDTMANCLAVQWANTVNMTVLPQLYASERRAAVTLVMIPAGVIAGDYQIRTNADSTVEVEWRWYAGNPAFGREKADRCAAAA